MRLRHPRLPFALALACLIEAPAPACVPVAPKPPLIVGETPPPTLPLPKGPVQFDFESLDDQSVSAPAFRGKPAVLAFIVSDTLAGQAEADIVESVAHRRGGAARFAIVAVEPGERHELVQGFVAFFTAKSHAPLLGAMADKDTLIGLGPFGDVRGLTVVVLDAGGYIVLRRAGLVPAVDIERALAPQAE